MIRIRIPDSAFAPGGPLAGKDPKTTTVVIYTSTPDGTWDRFWRVDRNGLELEDIQFDHAFYGQQRDLTEYMIKGVLVVEHNGTPLTVQEVRDFSA